MHKTKRTAVFVGVVLTGAAFAGAQVNPPIGFFDWDTNTSPGTNFQVSPFLSDNPADIANTKVALDAASAKNRPLAVKIVTPLNTPASKAIFNQYAISYVFADFEDADSITQTQKISALVLNSTKSKNAFVGNFNVYPNSGADSTRPASVSGNAESFSAENVPQTGQYAAIRAFSNGVGSNRMSNEALYPGAPDYRNPANGNSNAPNIRSALFTLPILRNGFATDNLQYNNGLHQHIPWVSRFNNWGNTALDTDGNPNGGAFGHKYEFVQNALNPADGQLPSRGDFQAQILHYRLRGADSVNMFEGGENGGGSVVGYSRQDSRNDIISGWSGSSVASGIFSRKNYAFANLGSVVTVMSSGIAQNMSSESVGTLWSGVFDKSGTGRRLAILISNLSDVQRRIDLPNDIGGFRTSGGDGDRTDDFIINAGSHRLLAFTLSGGMWQLNSSSVSFTDNNRNGVGIPEPATIGLLGLGAVGLLIRRRRRA